jgi:hypothetical protein
MPDDAGHLPGDGGGTRHSFVCHVDLDKALAAAKELSQARAAAAAAADTHSNTPKSSKKRNRSTREGDEGGAAEAGVSAAANFSMVLKYGPLLCAEFLTGHNLLLVERFPSPSQPFDILALASLSSPSWPFLILALPCTRRPLSASECFASPACLNR